MFALHDDRLPGNIDHFGFDVHTVLHTYAVKHHARIGGDID